MLCTIVGAGRGLSAGIAQRFASEGFSVALVARDIRGPEETAAAIRSTGGEARCFAGDASEPQIGGTFEEIASWRGPTDVLVYNAAVMVPGLASDLTTERAMADMETNLGGALRSVGVVLPSMRGRGAGTIILTGGGLSLEPYPEWTSLAAGKAALRAYGLALHKEMAPEGIHVAVVAVCGIVEPGGPFDPALIADAYWRLHAEGSGTFTRELVYLPGEADPFYNDPTGRWRSTSHPIGAASPCPPPCP